MRLLSFLLVLAVAAVGVAVYFVSRDDSSNNTASPAQWDPRVLPLVHFVEHARGLPFKHPIKVEFLSDAEFRSRLLGDVNPNSSKANEQARDALSLYRAVGLVAGNVDLREQAKQFTGSSVVGLYSFETKSLAVRGTRLTLAVKDTLVHELTHALQDQYFDVAAATRRVDKDPRSSDSALRTVVEGDAVRIERMYAKSLSAGQRRELQREQDAEGNAADRATRSVPQILVVTEQGPYVLGPEVLDFAARAKGSDGPDYLLGHLPGSDMQVMQPWRYLAGNLARTVPEPALRSGEQRIPDDTFTSGTFGAQNWYYMLAEQLGPTAALRAVDGWAGDAFVAFHRRGRTCFRTTYDATSHAALQSMSGALRSWIRQMPAANEATETLHSDDLSFASCDPGPKLAKPVKRSLIPALRLLVERVDVATALVHSGLSAGQAGCAVERIATRLPQRAFESNGVSAHIRSVIRASVVACR